MASKLLGIMTILIFIFGFLYLGFQLGRIVGKDEVRQEYSKSGYIVIPSCLIMQDCDKDLSKEQGTENGVPGAQF